MLGAGHAASGRKGRGQGRHFGGCGPQGKGDNYDRLDSGSFRLAWLASNIFRELVHVNSPVGIFDFTPGEGHMAMATLLKRGTGTHDGLIYCGWCHTESHATMLRKRLADRVLKAMHDPTSELYSPVCAKANYAHQQAVAATPRKDNGETPTPQKKKKKTPPRPPPHPSKPKRQRKGKKDGADDAGDNDKGGDETDLSSPPPSEDDKSNE